MRLANAEAGGRLLDLRRELRVDLPRHELERDAKYRGDKRLRLSDRDQPPRRGDPLEVELRLQGKPLNLADSLQLVYLYAELELASYEPAALSWYVRLVTEAKSMSLLRAQVALAALQNRGPASRRVLDGLLAQA